MPRLELPQLDGTRCTGCGFCIAICPTRCLTSINNRPRLARPLDCISCTACVIVCPAQALALQSVGMA